MRNEIHGPKMDLVVSTENDVEDHLSGDEFAGVGDRCVRVAGSAGGQESTLRTWLTRSGAQSRKLHERFFRDLNLGHL